MVGVSIANGNAILHDLKHSNYFRLWAVLWFVCFILFFVGFGTYVSHVNQSSNLYATGFQSEGRVAYPSFHFRFQGWRNSPSAINVNSIHCTTGWNQTQVLQVGPCLGYNTSSLPVNGVTNCFAVLTSTSSYTVYATTHGNDSRPGDLFAPAHWGSFIFCNFTVNTTLLGSTPDWVAWELEGWTDFTYGDNAYSPLYFAPWSMTQVLLEKFVIDGRAYWERNNIYIPMGTVFNNTVDGTSQYLTSTALQTTTVSTFSQFSFSYKSWNALADIGGFAFALLIMHAVAMIILGLFLENDSTFLKGHHHHDDHDTAAGNGKPTERTSLVY